MRFTKNFKYNIKRALPILAIAGAGFMSSCDKEDEPTPVQHDVELKFFQDWYEEVEIDNIKKHVADPTVRIVYLSVVNGGDYTNASTENISNQRRFFTERFQIAPNKIKGRGNFQFEPGVILIEDNETIILGLQHPLEQENFQVDTAQNVVSAKSKIKKSVHMDGFFCC